jgi:hypothetical protein
MRSVLAFITVSVLLTLACSGAASAAAGSDPVLVSEYAGTSSYLSETVHVPGIVWARAYDYGWGEGVVRLDDGFVVAGTTMAPAASSDIFLLKVDRNGDRVWNNSYGGPREDKGFDVIVDDGFVVVGSSRSFSLNPLTESKVYLLRTFPNGTMAGFSVVGPVDSLSTGYAVVPYMANGYLVAGSTSMDSKSQAFISATGNYSAFTTGTTISVGELNVARGALQVPGGYLVTGTCDGRLALFKTDAYGNLQWLRVYQEVRGRGEAIILAGDGYVIAGYDLGPDYYNLCLAKVDDNGTLLWKRSFGGPDDEYGVDLANVPGGGIVAAGYVTRDNNGDIYLVNVDYDGSLINEWTVRGEDSTVITAMTLSNDANPVLAGYTLNDTSAPRVYLVELDLSELEPDSAFLEPALSEAAITADLSGDGKVNSLDALLAMKMARNGTPTALPGGSSGGSAQDILKLASMASLGSSSLGKPVADFAVSFDAASREYAFNASDSRGSGLSYAWAFGDDTKGSGQTITHKYAAPGKYNVTLTVRESSGLSDSKSMTVSIDSTSPGLVLATPTKTPITVTPASTAKPAINKPPVALFNYTYKRPVLNLTAAKSYDLDGKIVLYNWSMQNAKTKAMTSLGADVTVKYAMTQAGTYVVTLKVTDDDKATGTYNETITITAV